MTLVCNGKPMTIREGMSLEELILELELNPDTVVAECDGLIARREEYATSILKDGMVVELIRFVGGG
jgi:sulfur carrier protein